MHTLIGQKMSFQISSICLSHDECNKVCCNENETSVDFLDVTIFPGSGFSSHNILDIKVHFKDKDIHMFGLVMRLKYAVNVIWNSNGI